LLEHELFEVLLGGVVIGSAYIIAVIGLSLIYGVSEVFNYAYGSLLMLAAYLAWLLSSTVFSGVYYPLVFIIIPPIMFGLGVIIERGICRPLRRQPNWMITSVIATLGLGLMMNSLFLVFFGPYAKVLPSLRKGIIHLGGFTLAEDRLIILLTGIAIVVILALFLSKTRLGMSMRAVAQDIVGARIVGIPLDRVFGYTFGVSTALAGISGIFIGSIYTLSPEGGWLLFIRAFVILALGGVGSLRGAVCAALILGIMENVVSWQLGSLWVFPFWFVVFLVILTLRPRGLFGIR